MLTSVLMGILIVMISFSCVLRAYIRKTAFLSALASCHVPPPDPFRHNTGQSLFRFDVPDINCRSGSVSIVCTFCLSSRKQAVCDLDLGMLRVRQVFISSAFALALIIARSME